MELKVQLGLLVHNYLQYFTIQPTMDKIVDIKEPKH